ncbi:MAG: hypothetical protein DMG88_04310 [Acidobacteria bacterium]|nr:MAG: hypothetical protein DMG88_04310 [Acidobacteriota bacterium]
MPEKSILRHGELYASLWRDILVRAMLITVFLVFLERYAKWSLAAYQEEIVLVRGCQPRYSCAP